MNEPKPDFSNKAYLFPHINPEGIKSLLEKPDSLDAFKLGKKMSREILVKSMAVENEANRNLEMQNVANLDNVQPQINPVANAPH